MMNSVIISAGRQMRSSTVPKSSQSYNKIEDDEDLFDLVDTLRRKLSIIIPLMKDAEDKQFTEPSVKSWLVDLKHTIYDSNTLLDHIDTDARLKNLDIGREIICTPKQEASSQVKEMIKKLVEFTDDGQKNLGLIPQAAAEKPHVSDDRITTSSWEDSDAVCGRDVAKDQMMKRMFSSPAEHGIRCNKVDVIAIVGMGGLGKTTLAKFVYNHADVETNFRRSWACVSDRFSLRRVTRTILETLTGCPAQFRTFGELQRELKKELSGKKFLIVLDDVWQRSRAEWQKLMVPFSRDAPGSKVIVTTRDRFVASVVVSANYTYELRPMSEDEGLSLFSKIVSGNNDISRYSEMEAIGKKIVVKCGCLPLAIKTLGDLLRLEKDVRVWESFSESSFWQLSDGRNDVVSALRLSYSYLPSHLKTCFAYCALFPRGYEFSEDELVNLWIDEGFLPQQNDDDKLVKNVAKSYFKDLASRSFFTRPYGDVDVYVMHDVMHDLSRLLYEDFHRQLDGRRTARYPKKVRHVSFHGRECNGRRITGEDVSEMKCLQTFLAHKMHPRWSLDDKMLQAYLLQQPSLRVLCLRGSSVRALPEEIGNLMLLRCLDVSYTVVDSLPHSLFKLHNLQRLLCDGCDHLKELHNEMTGLDSLRCFTLSGKHLREAPRNLYQLRDCSVRLVFSLPLDVVAAQENLSGSGHGHGGQVAMVNQAAQPDCDGSLLYVKVDIDKSGFSYTVQDYNHFTRADHRNLLESLRPHKDSRKVSIQYFNGRGIPDRLVDRSYHNIHVVELSHCRLSSGTMPMLGQLPSLQRLHICNVANMKIIGREFYACKDPFGSLEELSFEDMRGWEEWEQSDDDVAGGICCFPRLRNLKLVSCPSLKGRLPAQLPSLMELIIDGCHSLVNSCLAANRFFMFSSLRTLILAGCDSVDSFPAEGSIPPSLTSLQIKRFTELKRLDGTGLPSLIGLEMLLIDDCIELNWLELQSLTSLKILNISQCPKLEALSVETLSRTLEDLHLFENHPNLVEQCQRDSSISCSRRHDPLKSLKLTVGWLFGSGTTTFMR